jgi:hypothetical protein
MPTTTVYGSSSTSPGGTDLGANKAFQGRLTLSSGDASPEENQDNKTNLYLTPYNGNQIALYDGVGTWTNYTLSEISIDTTGLSIDTNYDAYVYDSSGLNLELVAWSTNTARTATVPVLQDGVYCKTGDLTKRYVGTIRTVDSTGAKFQDSYGQRYVWNFYNRLYRPGFIDPTGSTHTYTTFTWREFANQTTYGSSRVGYVTGFPERTTIEHHGIFSNSTISVAASLGFGFDTTSVRNNSVSWMHTGEAGHYAHSSSTDSEAPSTPGFHYWTLLECSTATGTTTWYDYHCNATMSFYC